MKKLLISICVFLLITALNMSIAEETGTIDMPEELTTIEAEAFAGLTNAGAIIVPEGTLSVGPRAFANSTFERISLPGTLTEIADDAFEGCGDFEVDVPEDSYAYNWCAEHGLIDGLAAPEEHFVYVPMADGTAGIAAYTGPGGYVIVPDTLDGYKVTGIGGYAFYGCKSITGITLPEGVTVLGDWAFAECSNLQKIVLPDSLMIVGRQCFDLCYSLEEIFIPAGVTEIGMKMFAFQQCYALKEINVSKDNMYYSSTDGVLYSATGTLLVSCPAGKEGVFTVPEDTTRIGSYAFISCIYISDIILPSSVTTIDANAFIYSNPDTIYMPDSVTSIADDAFEYCYNVQFICESYNAAAEYAEKHGIEYIIE